MSHAKPRTTTQFDLDFFSPVKCLLVSDSCRDTFLISLSLLCSFFLNRPTLRVVYLSFSLHNIDAHMSIKESKSREGAFMPPAATPSLKESTYSATGKYRYTLEVYFGSYNSTQDDYEPAEVGQQGREREQGGSAFLAYFNVVCVVAGTGALQLPVSLENVVWVFMTKFCSLCGTVCTASGRLDWYVTCILAQNRLLIIWTSNHHRYPHPLSQLVLFNL